MTQSLLANLADLETIQQVAYYEGLSDLYNYFNANSGGAIVLQNSSVTGVTPERGYFTQTTANGGRRDTTSAALRTLAGMVQLTEKSAVLPGRQFDDMAISALKQRGIAPEEYVRRAGENMAANKLNQTWTAAVSALVGSLTKQSTTLKTTSTLSSNYGCSIASLIDTKGYLGDQGMRCKGLIMHSKPYYAIMKEFGSTPGQLTQLGAGVVVDGQLSAVLGCLVLVSDASALKVAATTGIAYDTYKSIFVTEAAVVILDEETVPLTVTTSTLYDNAMISSLVEYNQDLRVKGFSYAGADFPTDATLATTASWTLKAASVKLGPGAILLSRD